MSAVSSLDERRAVVLAAEAEQLKNPQVPLQVVIHQIHGIHARELRIPAGVDFTGAIHLYENLSTLSQGEMLLTDGEVVLHVKAPCTIVSPAGTKRGATSLTDCVWTSYFATDLTDPDEVVAKFTTNSEQAYLEHAANLKLGET